MPGWALFHDFWLIPFVRYPLQKAYWLFFFNIYPSISFQLLSPLEIVLREDLGFPRRYSHFLSIQHCLSHLWAQLLAACSAGIGCGGILSPRLCLVCQFSPVAFLGLTVPIRRHLFMPVFCSNCKNLICFPPLTDISLICFHPYPCITALVRQEDCLSRGPRFLPEGLFVLEFICGCCNASKTLILWMCAACAAELEFVLSPPPGCSRSLRTWSFWSW